MFLNRIDYKYRLFFILSFAIGVASWRLLLEATRNQKRMEKRSIWVRERLYNPEATEFDKLDHEVPAQVTKIL